MRKIYAVLIAFGTFVLLVIGAKSRFPAVQLKASPKKTYATQEKLRRFYEAKEEKHFVFVVIADRVSGAIERQLGSICKQTYPHYRVLYFDNAAEGQVSEKIKPFSEKVTLTRFEKAKPSMQILYDAIHGLDPSDVVVYLSQSDWLAHENVLEHLNCAYANPSVWMTKGRAIHHPDYDQIEGVPFSDAAIEARAFRQIDSLSTLVTFPAHFFNQIRLEDFLFEGKFIHEKILEASLYPLLEMGADHLLFLDEVMLVKNDQIKKEGDKLHFREIMATESHLRSLKPYEPLEALDLHQNCSLRTSKGDVVVFSENGPLHLYACLESLYTKVRDINTIYVIYESHDHESGRGYLNLKSEFPNVEFLEICDYPGNDFESLLAKALTNKRYGAPFALLMEDGYIFDQKLRLHECIVALEKVHGNHFFLKVEEKDPLPETLPIEEGIYAWQLREENENQTFDLCLCRKEPFEKGLESHALTTLSHFKSFWKSQLKPHTVALFFDEKKGLPLSHKQEIPLAQKREWGQKFNEGYKIDLPSLLCEIDELENGEYPLIKREKWKPGLR